MNQLINFKKNVIQSEKINWFPGHMHKSLERLKKIIKEIDLVIFVKDARAIQASSNTELHQILQNKPILEVVLKTDLTSKTFFPLVSNCLYTNVYHKNLRNNAIQKIETIIDAKLKKFQNKGLINPIIQIIVCGLPNVGKSTFINQLVQKKIAQSADIPGITRAFQRHKFYKNMWIYDTPGIFYKRVDNKHMGYQLALIGCVKREVIPLKKTLEYAYTYLKLHFEPLLKQMIDSKWNSMMIFDDFIFCLSNFQNFFKQNNEVDCERAMWYFFDQIRTGKIGLISWDLI